MDPQQRADKYQEDRAKLRASTKAEAMSRLWAMAREALATRANLGVKELVYTSDLVPGVKIVKVTATEQTVVLELGGIRFGKDVGAREDDVRMAETYVLDEAWLLGVGA